MSAQAGIDYAAATDQRGLVLSILQSGRSLTREEAITEFNIWNLPTRICELRKAGYNVKSENVDCGGALVNKGLFLYVRFFLLHFYVFFFRLFSFLYDF